MIQSMTAKRTADQYSAKEAKQRLEAALRGAFSGSPTPLKDIPKKNGESRNQRRKQPKRRPSRKGV